MTKRAKFLLEQGDTEKRRSGGKRRTEAEREGGKEQEEEIGLV